MSLWKVKKTCLWVIVCQGGCYDKISSFPPFIHLINTSTPFVVTCNIEGKLQFEWKMNISVYRKLANNNNMSFWSMNKSMTTTPLTCRLHITETEWSEPPPTHSSLDIANRSHLHCPHHQSTVIYTSWSMGSPAHLINQFTGKDTY